MTGYDPREIKASQPLKPCPFCGGEARLDDDGEFQSVGCAACDFSICDSALGGADVVKHWNVRADDPDEAYEIGKQEGYESAVQSIDISTGGDGEYKGSTIPGETVDLDVMEARVIERCKRADVADGALAAFRAVMQAVENYDPDAAHEISRLAIAKLEGGGV